MQTTCVSTFCDKFFKFVIVKGWAHVTTSLESTWSTAALIVLCGWLGLPDKTDGDMW